MKNKPDDRRDNLDKIQRNIDNSIEKTDDEKIIKPLEEKNERRKEAIVGMRTEIRDEAIDKRNGYR